MAEQRFPEETFALLTPLVHYLVAAESVSVDEAALHFDTSPERIRRAVRLLSLTGVPNSWGDPTMFDFDFDAFDHEGRIEIRYLPALRDATVKLSPREAAAIVTGLERLAHIADDEGDRIAALAKRVRSATVANHLTVAAQAVTGDAPVRAVRRAVQEGTAITFRYRKPNSDFEERRIIPVRLEIHDEITLTAGYDLDREAMRTFRIDRMEDVELTERPHDIYFHDDRDRETAEEMTVHATPAAALSLAAYVSASEPADDGGRILAIEVWDIESVLRAIMATGGEARVIAPPSAVAAVGRLARAALR